MPKDSGPFLAVATFCQRLKQDPDGGLTIVRVANEFTVPDCALSAAGQSLPVTITVPAVICVYAGDYVGNAVVRIEPTKRRAAAMEYVVSLIEPSAYANVTITLEITERVGERIHFDVFLDGEWVTRMGVVLQVADVPTRQPSDEAHIAVH